MVRLAPSGCNYQPWRIIKEKDQNIFYFYVTRNYPKENPHLHGIPLVDWQRIDIGIAMCHFELTAEENGIIGEWDIREPQKSNVPDNTEYIVTWVEK